MARPKSAKAAREVKPSFPIDLQKQTYIELIALDLKVDAVLERLERLEKATSQNAVAQVFAIAVVGATALVGFHYGVPAGGVCAVVGVIAAALWQLVWSKKNNNPKVLP